MLATLQREQKKVHKITNGVSWSSLSTLLLPWLGTFFASFPFKIKSEIMSLVDSSLHSVEGWSACRMAVIYIRQYKHRRNADRHWCPEWDSNQWPPVLERATTLRGLDRKATVIDIKCTIKIMRGHYWNSLTMDFNKIRSTTYKKPG